MENVVALDDLRGNGFTGVDVVGWVDPNWTSVGEWDLFDAPASGPPATRIEVRVEKEQVFFVDAFNPFITIHDAGSVTSDEREAPGPYTPDSLEIAVDLRVNNLPRAPLVGVNTLRKFNSHYPRPILAIQGGADVVVMLHWRTTRDIAHPAEWSRAGVRLVGRIVSYPTP